MRWHAAPAADHSGLFKLIVLGISGKGARRRGLSLRSVMSADGPKRMLSAGEGMSAFEGKADMAQSDGHFGF